MTPELSPAVTLLGNTLGILIGIVVGVFILALVVIPTFLLIRWFVRKIKS